MTEQTLSAHEAHDQFKKKKCLPCRPHEASVGSYVHNSHILLRGSTQSNPVSIEIILVDE